MITTCYFLPIKKKYIHSHRVNFNWDDIFGCKAIIEAKLMTNMGCGQI